MKRSKTEKEIINARFEYIDQLKKEIKEKQKEISKLIEKLVEEVEALEAVNEEA